MMLADSEKRSEEFLKLENDHSESEIEKSRSEVGLNSWWWMSQTRKRK